MAVIHKSRHDPRRKLGPAALLMLLCLPLALTAVALSAVFYMDCGDRLGDLAAAWRDSFVRRAIVPSDSAAFTQSWHETLWTVLRAVLQGVSWLIYGGTLALPGMVGLALAALLIRLFPLACRRFGDVRARVRSMKAALRLLGPMPRGCHIFVHKRFCFEGESSQADMILVGTGGVMVIEVRNQSGLIEGSVTDASLRCRLPSGDVEKLRNPARQAVAHVTRLSGYLNSLGINVHVTPAVLFASEAASVYVSVPEELISDGRRTRLSACVMTDAENFWPLAGRSFANGHVLNQGLADQIALAITKAPEGKKRG